VSRLVLEVGTEAIPAGYVPPALAALESRTRAALEEARLPALRVSARGTAKRLVLEIEGLPERQEDRVREVQGPRYDIAFKDGEPTKAGEGFARKSGVAVTDLERVASEKGDFVLARVHLAGKPAREVLSDLLPRLIAGLEWPKTMTWDRTRFRFPRPVRWVVCLLDEAVLPVTLAGLPAGRTSRGHRLLAPGPCEVPRAEALDAVLREAGIVLDPDARRREIETGLAREAKALGGRCLPDPGLLDEVAFLVEMPVVFAGRFDPEFLELPREIVVTAMRSHQRYFAVEDAKGNLRNHFLVVCDGRWEDPAQVVAGNERVLRARLADARFYWNVDRKTGMDGLAEALKTVVWLEPVGTLYAKSERVVQLTDRVGRTLYAKEWDSLRDDALEAARLAKADLASEMIKDGKEFTGLQGLVGARYAEAAGASPAMTAALREQYLPRGAGDPLPETKGGTALAFADRLDTVAGCLAAGFRPTGSQDPYALRRAANGMIRILLEKKLHLSLDAAVGEATALLPEAVRQGTAVKKKSGGKDAGSEPVDLGVEIRSFLRERLASLLRERGIRYDVVDAVLAADAEDPVDARARAEALEAIRDDEALERLVIGFKRAANILKGIDEAGLPDPGGIDWPGAEAAERGLFKQLGRVETALAKSREKKDYPDMLTHLLSLRGPIDTFFDDVLVMSDNAAERDRRLALLAAARGLFHHVFDPARIVIEGE
jgi:glycyl-tRNA synthetase beta chain